jgi:hypothetical protein
MIRAALLCVALVGCSKILGIDNLKGANGTGDGGADALSDGATGDTAADAPSGAMVKVSGKATVVDSNLNSQPAANAPVDFFRLPDEVSIAQATTDPNGAYSLAVPAGTTGYVRVRGNVVVDSLDTLEYPAHPFGADTTLDVPLYSRTAINTLANLGAASQPASAAFGIAIAVTAAGAPISGAVVSTQPTSQVRYTNSAGQPSPTLGSTGPNGVAMMFAMAQQVTTFTSSMSGAPLVTRQIKVGTSSTYLIELKP